MECYRVIEIINLEPLKIGASGSKTNQTESCKDYIPGSTLRGAMINQLVRQGSFEQNKQKILTAMACYNSYPYRNGKLYLPTPRHLRVDKHRWRKKKAAYADRKHSHEQIELTDLLFPGKERRSSRNALEYPFLTIKDNFLTGLKVNKEYRLHHSTSINYDQEKKENLFRYQAISAGQIFRGIIHFDHALQSLIEAVFQQDNRIYLGGSRGSGYGLCRWQPIGQVLTDYQDAKKLLGLPLEMHSEFNDQSGDKLIITCLSDLLLRNKYGQPINFIPESYIKEISGKAVKLKKQFVEMGITEGYNATWQARYPKEATLKAGSVLQYTFQDKILNAKELQEVAEKLESRLLGGRNQDGFGWIGVNLPYSQTLLIAEDKQQQENKQEEVEQLLEDVSEEEKGRQVLAILVSGLEGAKDRWLKMICIKSWSDERGQVPDENAFILSSELKNAHYRQMQNLLEEPLKKLKSNSLPASYRSNIPGRFYKNDNRLCSIAKCNFTEIIKYLGESRNSQDSMLSKFARKRLKTRQGTLFYKNTKHSEKLFIAELLNMGLSIQGGRTNE